MKIIIDGLELETERTLHPSYVPSYCTQFTDRECRVEDCCLTTTSSVNAAATG